MGIKPEAASPSTVYRVLAVRTGGGIGVGLLSPTSWGAIVLLRKDFCLTLAPFTRTSGVRLLVPLISLSDACSDTAYRDACTIGNVFLH